MDNKPIPVFIKRNDSSTFKQMKLDEISKIVQELEHKLGPFEKGGATIARGGDIFIRPSTIDQQRQLLKLKKVLNGSIDVNCSLPKSHTSQKVIIRQVPTGDTDEEILQTLQKNGYKVSSAYRFSTMKGTEKIPSTTVALEFDGQFPQEILLNNLVFIPERQLPSPLRCKNCQKLGHTKDSAVPLKHAQTAAKTSQTQPTALQLQAASTVMANTLPTRRPALNSSR